MLGLAEEWRSMEYKVDFGQEMEVRKKKRSKESRLIFGCAASVLRWNGGGVWKARRNLNVQSSVMCIDEKDDGVCT